mmetsp:Transcript_132557/g.383156  ORF Transcript_132557/g.383156 Transcript_132557/m.383156 type:complete len:312 (-) Transcript_132557:452-1387(-)
MAAGCARLLGLRDERAPRLVIALDERHGEFHAVNLGVQVRLALAAGLLQVVEPLQALGDAARHDTLHISDGPRLGQGSAMSRADGQDLPIRLALVNEANGAQRAALNDLPDARHVVAKVEDVQRIVIARSAMDGVELVRVAVCLRQTAVIERHRATKCGQLHRALRIFFDGVLWQMRLNLKLLQAAHRHLVHIPVQSCVLVQPTFHVQLHIVPERVARRRRRDIAADPLRQHELFRWRGHCCGRCRPGRATARCEPGRGRSQPRSAEHRHDARRWHGAGLVATAAKPCGGRGDCDDAREDTCGLQAARRGR